MQEKTLDFIYIEITKQIEWCFYLVGQHCIAGLKNSGSSSSDNSTNNTPETKTKANQEGKIERESEIQALYVIKIASVILIVCNPK